MSLSVHREVLRSGLTVVTVEAPWLHSAMCTVSVRLGSRHETRADNGVSHMLEHLFFRGTRRWPDSRKMNEAVEAVGGNLNGVTMRDLSYFYTPVHPDGVGLALQILGDMVSHPRLLGIETEKKVILEEMLDEVDEKGRDIDTDNLGKRLLYGDHPLSLKIAGTPETVRSLTRTQVVAHFKRAYTTGNLVVSVAGPVKHAAVRRQVKKHFADLRVGPRLTERPAPPVVHAGARLHFVKLEESQVELKLSFPTVSDEHPDHLALATLRRVLDDGLSSRLPHTGVEKLGLAYGIGAALDSYHDAGSFDIDGAAAPGNAAKVVEQSLKVLKTLKGGQITQEELHRARRRFRMHLDFLLDSPGDLCGWFGGTEVYRPAESFEQKCRRVDALTRADLVRVAKTYFIADSLTVVAVGSRSCRAALQKIVDRAPKLL